MKVLKFGASLFSKESDMIKIKEVVESPWPLHPAESVSDKSMNSNRDENWREPGIYEV